MVEGSGTSRLEQVNSDIQTQPRRAQRNKPVRSRTVYGEAVRLTQGSPTDLMLVAAIGTIKPERLGDPEAHWEKTIGLWLTDSQGCTEDPGPVKHW